MGNLCSSDASAADCRPSGSALDSLYSSYLADPGPLSGEVAYYSPGLMCPSGYATVGLATKLADGSATSSGDAFPQAGDDDDDDDSASFDLLNPGLNALVEAMGPGETAIVCCPRYVWSSPIHEILSRLGPCVAPTGALLETKAAVVV